ncbi:hypothetical protein L6164_020227 [Bauhinia variegata]|uniref:Uncharacterized protein n=1 Tax=Bauhinia variegata TaxID=167791 RepID=A0ACB9MUP8_BAUVA|nr:hypothetical protein L6164_020227 [Bauhinia variegata]
MTVASQATARTKKLVKLTLSVLRLGFNSSKCKMAAKMAVARIKLLRNKREVVVRQMRRDIALLLKSGQDATAHIRVEHVTREQNVLAANEFIELFCELVVARLSIIAKERECPADLKEGIASIIFAAAWCSEIPELVVLKNIFEKKYGKDFVSAATGLRPNSGVNRLLIDKLSVRTPPGEVKLKAMKEIAKEYQIEWDTTESEKELLKPPEELIGGPRTFVSASSMPVNPSTIQSMETNELPNRGNTNPCLSSGGGKSGSMHFEDSASAAEAAAESAKKAIAAAEVAAYLAKKEYDQAIEPSVNMEDQFKAPEKLYKSHSLPRSNYINNEEDTMPAPGNGGSVYRRHSYNPTSAHSNIHFDESDCDEEIEMEEPSDVLPPQVKQYSDIRVHPKLPDYDELAARFQSLKLKRSQS